MKVGRINAHRAIASILKLPFDSVKKPLNDLLPKAVFSSKGKILEPFVPHLAREIIRVLPQVKMTAEELIAALKENNLTDKVEDLGDVYKAIVNERKALSQLIEGHKSVREINKRIFALSDLVHDLGTNQMENVIVATKCLREALGYSGVRVYSVDLTRGTWLHRYSEGEEGISRFNEPKVPAANSEKYFLTELLQGKIPLEKINEDRKNGLYEWFENGEWYYFYIPDRSRCDFVDKEQLRKDEEGDPTQQRNGYGSGSAREILYLVFGKKGDEKVDVYMVTNWMSKKPLFVNKEGDIKLLRAFASALGRARELAKAYQKIEDESVYDELTGVHNRRYFNKKIDAEVTRALRDNLPLTLLMLDLDHFKQINDAHGHQVGDEVLKAVATAIRKSIRDKIDVVVRYGGEEFSVILPFANGERGENALEIAERIRQEVEKIEIKVRDNKSLRITVSIGLASLHKHASSIGDLIYKADQALYQAKDNGRNRVEVAD